MRNTDTNNVGGMSGMVASAATASGLGDCTSNQTNYLQNTLPARLAGMNAFERILQMWVWVAGWGIIGGINYALYRGIQNDSLPPFLAEISFLFVPLFFILIPLFYLITGIPISLQYMNCKMKARLFDPGTPTWNSLGNHPGGVGGLLTWLITVVLYVPFVLPFFILQDVVELAKTIGTLGKHKFRTSKGRYFEKQKRQYRHLLKNASKMRAEEFLRDSTMAMYFPVTTATPSLDAWLKGECRGLVIPAMERRYGPLTPNAEPRPAPKEKHFVRHEFDHVKVKPIKL